jgi:hypothetical protein
MNHLQSVLVLLACAALEAVDDSECRHL